MRNKDSIFAYKIFTLYFENEYISKGHIPRNGN